MKIPKKSRLEEWDVGLYLWKPVNQDKIYFTSSLNEVKNSSKRLWSGLQTPFSHTCRNTSTLCESVTESTLVLHLLQNVFKVFPWEEWLTLVPMQGGETFRYTHVQKLFTFCIRQEQMRFVSWMYFQGKLYTQYVHSYQFRYVLTEYFEISNWILVAIGATLC